MDLKETDILGTAVEKHWYYRSKAKAMMGLLGTFIPSTILDVGAGSGFFSWHLLTQSTATVAWCIDISYTADSDLTRAGKQIHFRRSINSVDADLLLLMDVLEHVDDDVGLLKEYMSLLPCGSQVLISVPAFKILWSGHDIFLGHKRRYTLHHLEAVVKNAGLKVRHSNYYFGFVFPIAAAIRLSQKCRRNRGSRSQLTRHHPIVNSMLAALCSLELPLMAINKLAGLTVFCLAEKA